MKPYAITLILLLCSGCASSPVFTDPLASKVSALVNATTEGGKEQLAFAELEALGPAAVPYIVSHLGDMRLLPDREISLSNSSPNSFEGLRHYGPETVHDALSAILNQLTGQTFEFVYNGATSSEREANKAKWQAWCVKSYPTKAAACSG